MGNKIPLLSSCENSLFAFKFNFRGIGRYNYQLILKKESYKVTSAFIEMLEWAHRVGTEDPKKFLLVGNKDPKDHPIRFSGLDPKKQSIIPNEYDNRFFSLRYKARLKCYDLILKQDMYYATTQDDSEIDVADSNVGDVIEILILLHKIGLNHPKEIIRIGCL